MLVDIKHLKMNYLDVKQRNAGLHEASNVFEFDLVAVTTEMVRNTDTSLRKQPTFLNAATGFPAKRRLRKEQKRN